MTLTPTLTLTRYRSMDRSLTDDEINALQVITLPLTHNPNS